MELTIVPFEELTNEELHDLLKLRFDVFILEQQCLYPEIDGRDKSAVHLLLKEDGRLIGTLRFLKNGPELRIGRVVLAEDKRKHQLGTKMLQAMLAYICEREESPDIDLSAQTYLRTFYESNGFTAISDYYLEDGIEHVDMKWRKP